MLKAIFIWLDDHPSFYWVIVGLSTLAFILWIASAARRAARPAGERPARWLGPGLLFFGFVLVWRWPFLLVAHEFNPDESQLIAGAITLSYDPVFWRSVDGVTSGPLNSYLLLWLSWVGLPLDYFGARFASVLLMSLSALFCYRLLGSRLALFPARLATFALIFFFAAALEYDFLQYSTENVPMFLTALAAYCLFAARPEKVAHSRDWVGAAVAGLLPWAKLQAAPLVLALLGWRIWEFFRSEQSRIRPWPAFAARLSLAMLTPSLVAVAALGITGQLDAFFRRYFLQNLAYVGEKQSFGESVSQYFQALMTQGDFAAYALPALMTAILAMVWSRTRRVKFSKFFWGAAWLVGVAVICILVPRRPFVHYLLLVAVPLCLWFGASLHTVWITIASSRRKTWCVAASLALFCFLPLAQRLRSPPPEIFGHFSEHWRYPRGIASNILHACRTPGDSLAVWGWLGSVFVEAGMPQATRDFCSYWSILPSRQRDYYRQVYLEDLARSRPALFVDAVGPGTSFFPDRAAAAHETFPALRDYIAEHYRLIIDLGHARLYARLEGIRPELFTSARLQELVAKARKPALIERLADEINPLEAARAVLDQRTVQLLLPPAQMAWTLKGTERELSIDYGFHPRGYTEGISNGAELLIELHANGFPPRGLYRRFLDPNRARSDQIPQQANLVLPPFAAGDRLVVRSIPGPFDDNAWDWLYVSRVSFRDLPFFTSEQFPGFSRSPDLAQAQYATLLNTNNGGLLQLHAPGSLTFILGGAERSVDFSYGFRQGTYSGDGRTDGAVFKIELQRAGSPPQEIFSRFLRPVDETADQGEQRARVDLPLIQPGDQLVLQVLPGGNNSWDWTYVREFQLH